MSYFQKICDLPYVLMAAIKFFFLLVHLSGRSLARNDTIEYEHRLLARDSPLLAPDKIFCILIFFAFVLPSHDQHHRRHHGASGAKAKLFYL